MRRRATVVAGWLALAVVAASVGSCGPVPEQPPATVLASWTTRQPAPVARYEANGATVDGVVHVFGGFINTSVHASISSIAYDVGANTWSSLPDLPTAVTHAPTAVDGDRIWLLGGLVGHHPGPATDAVWVYDVGDRTWTAGPALPQRRGAGAAGIVGRSLHFYGGGDRPPDTSGLADAGEHWALDLDAPEAGWQVRAPMPDPRNHLGGIAAGGKLYALGGQHGADDTRGNTAAAHRYDPVTDAWETIAPLPEARGHLTAGVVELAGRVVTVGGTVSGNAASSSVRAFDPGAGAWLRLPPLPQARKAVVAGVVGDVLVATTGNAAGSTPTSETWTTTHPRRWEVHPGLPTALGEVAAGAIGGHLYVVGQGSSSTFDLDLGTGAWRTRAARPLVDHHHAAEVVGGRLYLFGGMGAAAGTVQVYDPATGLWGRGADMPTAAGSVATAVIDGQVYAAGGVAAGTTTTAAARYDPVADSWSALPDLPAGRNHAAGGSDGRRFFVISGRGPGSGGAGEVANGFDTVQVFDPLLGLWSTSDDAVPLVAALPRGRGGTGRAVSLGGRLYVLGGETVDGPGATSDDVYRRVDVLDAATGEWQEATPMPMARHGISPVAVGGRIYVAAGGTKAGFSASTLLEVYNP